MMIGAHLTLPAPRYPPISDLHSTGDYASITDGNNPHGATMNQGLGANTPESAIGRALSELNSSILEVEQLIQNIEVRYTSVMRPSRPEKDLNSKTPADVQMAQSPVKDHLDNMQSRLTRICRHLNEIAERAEV
jgi:hypothetical protein